MPIDTSIYAAALPRAKSVLDYQNELQQQDLAKQSMQQNALALQQGRQKLNEYTRSLQAQQGVRNKLAALAPGATDADRANALYSEGSPEAIAIADKLRAAADNSRKVNAEAGAKDVETQNKVIGFYKDVIGMARDPQTAEAYVRSMHADPRLADTPMARVPLEVGLAQIGQDPESFNAWKQQFALGASKYIEQNKPQYITQNLGGTSQITAAPGLGGPAQVVSSSPITQSPDNAATVGASLANAAAMREQAQATRDAAKIQKGYDNEQSLRKEFEGLPEVKNYKQAYPAYSAIKDAVARNTTQSDINIVYGLAKLYDPNSVVREGEYATVANSPNIPERIKGYAQYLSGGGKLSPDTKRQIMDEAKGRIGTYKAEADKARASYESIARGQGINPAAVFPAMGDIGSSAVTAQKNDIHSQAEAILRGGK